MDELVSSDTISLQSSYIYMQLNNLLVIKFVAQSDWKAFM